MFRQLLVKKFGDSSGRIIRRQKKSCELENAKHFSRSQIRDSGQMSEWFKEHAWKACVGETLPWVRIPLCPPSHF